MSMVQGAFDAALLCERSRHKSHEGMLHRATCIMKGQGANTRLARDPGMLATLQFTLHNFVP